MLWLARAHVTSCFHVVEVCCLHVAMLSWGELHGMWNSVFYVVWDGGVLESTKPKRTL
jgi:hypothetical protein